MKQAASIRYLVAAGFALSLAGGASPATAESLPCGCYCNVWLPAPCSDEACKSACGWQDPAAASQEPAQNYAEQDRQARIEADRISKEEEARRLDAEKAEKERQFLASRDEAARSLKGGTGAGLGLKGASPADLGLRELESEAVGEDEEPKPSGALKRASARLRAAIGRWRDEFASGKESKAARNAENTEVFDGAVRAYANDYPKYPKIDEIERSPGREAWLRGMDAVMKHDWQLALAWFQTAQQKDPGNKALGRAVDLSQWTWNYRQKTPAAVSAVPLESALQVPEDKDMELLFFSGHVDPSAPALQIPVDGDIEYLFPDLIAKETTK